MIDGWFDAVDQAMLLAFPPERIAALKIRERIRDLIMFRIEAIAPQREALRRALAILAMPQNAEPPAKISTAAQKTRREPNRSAIQPLTGMNTARLKS